MNETITTESCRMMPDYVEALVQDTANRLLKWKVHETSTSEKPVFYLDGQPNIILCQGEDKDGYDSYMLYAEESPGSKRILLSGEYARLSHPSELRILFYLVTSMVSEADKPSSDRLFEQLRAYTAESMQRAYLARIRATGTHSESNCTSIQKLFALCQEAAVVPMYLSLMEDEKGCSLPPQERNRLSTIITAAITIIRETVCEPNKHLFSLKSSLFFAETSDGEKNLGRLTSNLHKLAGCRCAFAHELEPMFGYYLTHIETITPQEYATMQDTVNRACALLLRGVLANF